MNKSDSELLDALSEIPSDLLGNKLHEKRQDLVETQTFELISLVAADGDIYANVATVLGNILTNSIGKPNTAATQAEAAAVVDSVFDQLPITALAEIINGTIHF